MPESFTYTYPRPMVTVDLVVFGLAEGGLRSLFIRRKKDPFAGHWAIPGGYLEMDEPIETGARRELAEETGLRDLAIVEEIGAFGAPGRDPRGRTISVAHAGVVRAPLPPVSGGDDAADAAWLSTAEAAPLAFDHAEILARAKDWLRGALRRDEVVLAFLPQTFARAEVSALLKAGGGVRTSRWIARARESGMIQEARGEVGRFRRASKRA